MAEIAERLARIREDHEPREQRLKRANELLGQELPLSALSELGAVSEALVDLRYLNDPPPSDPFFGAVCDRLEAALAEAEDHASAWEVAWGLSTVARVCGRSRDPACEKAHRVLLSGESTRWVDHYNYGLFLKNRGRFAESLEQNRLAADAGGAEEPSVQWNLAIAATAVGEGAEALAVWKGIGCVLELGDDGLPRGGWPACEVRLAEHPVAERGADVVGPGLEETIWVQRLSPCHGRVRSALFQEDLGVDYGDLVLFDGAPVVVRERHGKRVPVFPHLATLRREGWTNVPFAATQQAHGRVDALGQALPGDLDLYVHTERFRQLCRSCWEAADHGDDHQQEERRVVTGKLVAPPGMSMSTIAEALDAALAETDSVRLFVPDVREQAGQPDRAAVERRRAQMLQSAQVTG